MVKEELLLSFQQEAFMFDFWGWLLGKERA